ncbi:MAG: hypothetical protein JWN73_3466 [Betaproteobacteria bacterium]|nr:hypothetical protein [Betaproteobacteria bacterium]
MSMLTRCPECGTSFRITTDQLVSRQGKVRCGRCQFVFSALASLVHTRDPAAHPISDSLGPLDADSRFSVLDANSRPMPVEPEPILAERETAASPASPAGPATDGAEPSVVRPLHRLTVDGDEGKDQAQERPRRRIAWLSLTGVVLAVLALAAQGAYFYRDQLGQWQPETKPWLAQMCAKLACKVETPIDPQAISIESSSLEADPADPALLQLNALLRNRSALAQKLPFLELTLIDAQETPQARRVIRPEEYSARGVGAPLPQLGADGEYQIRLSIDASQLKANGYRLYAFYP